MKEGHTETENTSTNESLEPPVKAPHRCFEQHLLPSLGNISSKVALCPGRDGIGELVQEKGKADVAYDIKRGPGLVLYDVCVGNCWITRRKRRDALFKRCLGTASWISFNVTVGGAKGFLSLINNNDERNAFSQCTSPTTLPCLVFGPIAKEHDNEEGRRIQMMGSTVREYLLGWGGKQSQAAPPPSLTINLDLTDTKKKPEIPALSLMDKNKLSAGMTKQGCERNRGYDLVRGKPAPGAAQSNGLQV
jgi:hypothetical protein